MSTGALLPPSPRTEQLDPRDDLGWVAAELGLTVDFGADPAGSTAAWHALVGLALRRNPRRAHLLVSRVLGKHLPVEPRVALQAAADLALAVREITPQSWPPPLVLGFAETATALGQAVAAALPGADCALSTRRPGAAAITFDEEHSHAVGHRILAPAAMIEQPRPVVLVDDELSSGRTAVNTIRALHRRSWHPGYIVAALLDMRPTSERAEFDRLAGELGVPVSAASLLSGALHVPADAPGRVAALVAAADPPQRLTEGWPVRRVFADWPAHLALCARYGWTSFDEAALTAAVAALASRLAAELPAERPFDVIDAGVPRVLVLGTEELMYAPLRLAAALAVAQPATEVRYQSTTRSPVAPLDRDGYTIRCALTFAAPDEPERESFVYNVRPGIADHIVVVTDGGDTAPLLSALSGCAPVTEVQLRDEVGAPARLSESNRR